MKKNLAMYVNALLLLTTLVVTVQLSAQEKQDHQRQCDRSTTIGFVFPHGHGN